MIKIQAIPNHDVTYPAEAVGLGVCFVLPPEGNRFNTELEGPSTDCAVVVSY